MYLLLKLKPTIVCNKSCYINDEVSILMEKLIINIKQSLIFGKLPNIVRWLGPLPTQSLIANEGLLQALKMQTFYDILGKGSIVFFTKS